MSRITVIGAGPLGRAAISKLVSQGHDVVVATRHEVSVPAARWQMADIVTGEGVDLLPSCEAIVACHGIPYSIAAWQRMWPMSANNLIDAARERGARLVMTGNLYACARDRMPMRATDPLAPSTPLGRVRAEVTRRLFDAHTQGSIEAVEVRGSDYFGADAPDAYLGKRIDQHCSQVKLPMSCRDLRIDTGQHTVFRGEEQLILTRREYDLLATLMSSNQPLSREQLLDRVWKYEAATETNVVDVYIRYLRGKIDLKGQPSYIQTVRGVGYSMRRN